MVVLNEIQVTDRKITAQSGSMCTSVTYDNKSDKTVSFNEFDWKLQLPSGEVKDAFDTTIQADSLSVRET